jgi:F0F1-type ATP synthase assembly protein I
MTQLVLARVIVKKQKLTRIFIRLGIKQMDKPPAMQWVARLSAIITILPASMAAGWILGYFLVDRFLRVFPWGSIGFTLIGAGAGFYEIIRLLVPDRNRRKSG